MIFMRILYKDYWAFGQIMIMGSESQQLWLRFQTQVDHFSGNSPISPFWFVPYTHTRLLWSHLSCEVARMHPETRNRHGLSPLIIPYSRHIHPKFAKFSYFTPTFWLIWTFKT